MLFPKRPDWKTVTTAPALGGSYSMTLSREFWLESLIVRISVTTSAAGGTETADGIWNLLKRARMSVTDATGNRKVIDVTGAALMSYWRNVVGSLDRASAAMAPGTTGADVATTTTYVLYYPIPLRHPQLQDPFGAATMLPLPRLSVDPVLELDLCAGADIGSTPVTISAGRIDVLLNRRDVLVPNFPYIPGELITYEKQWAASGKGDWEIPALGTVTGILHQNYTSATAKGSVLTTAATDDWSLEYLSSIIRRHLPDFASVENEYTMDLYPATWNNPSGELYWDFLTDFAGMDAFNLGSALDLNPLALNGGKARIIGSGITGGANIKSMFTVHKLFGDLKSLKFV